MRPWRRAELELPDGLVAVTGPNGAGKTSLVEAIVLGCLGVSPRTAREAEIVRRGAEALHVTLDLEGPSGANRREIGFAPRRGRRLRLDGEPAPSLAAWRARGAVLVFIPDELRSVKGPPAARRRALDRLIEASEPGYAERLSGYLEALAQRNALLRRVRAGQTGPATLPAFEARMAELGAVVAAGRRRAVAAIEEPFSRWLEALGGGPEGRLAVEVSPADLAEVPEAELEGAIAEALAGRREREIAAAQTLTGPHRDDLLIAAGETDLRKLGSQGEQRTAALALLLAGREHLSACAARPILLLDDVLSELDPERRERLLLAVGREGQALVTSADPHVVEGLGAHLVRVEDGHVAA